MRKSSKIIISTLSVVAIPLAITPVVTLVSCGQDKNACTITFTTDGKGKVIDNTTKQEITTLKIKRNVYWSEVKTKISFVANDENYIVNQITKDGILIRENSWFGSDCKINVTFKTEATRKITFVSSDTTKISFVEPSISVKYDSKLSDSLTSFEGNLKYVSKQCGIEGWYTDSTYQTPVDMETIVKNDMSLYVKVIDVDAPGKLDQTMDEIIIICTNYENGQLTKQQFLNSFTISGKQIQYDNTLIGSYVDDVLWCDFYHTFKIIGINHDTITSTGKKAALTFDCANTMYCATCAWDWDGVYGQTGKGDYTNSTLRKNLNGTGNATLRWASLNKDKSKTAIQLFDSPTLTQAIKEVNKEVYVPYTDEETGETKRKLVHFSDKLFPLTLNEMAQTSIALYQSATLIKDWKIYDTLPKEGYPYPYWQINNNHLDWLKYDPSKTKSTDHPYNYPLMTSFDYKYEGEYETLKQYYIDTSWQEQTTTLEDPLTYFSNSALPEFKEETISMSVSFAFAI